MSPNDKLIYCDWECRTYFRLNYDKLHFSFYVYNNNSASLLLPRCLRLTHIETQINTDGAANTRFSKGRKKFTFELFLNIFKDFSLRKKTHYFFLTFTLP